MRYEDIFPEYSANYRIFKGAYCVEDATLQFVGALYSLSKKESKYTVFTALKNKKNYPNEPNID
jgi:hypothetical protein